ncbi:unnamed protein product [Cylicostephanus goldi]|uniref:ABC transporter domain-containing protein n=1 Tax=Cylicostephanus goldi TaxID=71465 RepID=A0A3P6QCC9_CYLGO|nr:unnamed protein product [Cylicostephanus goldi]
MLLLIKEYIMQKSIYRHVLASLRVFAPQVGGVAFVAVLFYFSMLVLAYLRGYSIDVLTSALTFHDLLKIACTFVVLGLFYFLIAYFHNMSRKKLQKKVGFHLRHVVLEKIRVSDYQEVYRTGETLNILALLESDIPKISRLSTMIVDVVINVIELVVVLFLLYTHGLLVCALGIAVLICSIVSVHAFSKKMEITSACVQKTWDACLKNYQQQISQCKNIRLLGIARLYKKYEDALERYMSLQAVANAVYGASVGLIFLIEGPEVVKGTFSIGVIVTTVALLGEIVNPCYIVVSNIQEAQAIRSSILRFNMVLSLPDDREFAKTEKDSTIFKAVDKAILLDQVSFRYKGTETNIINNFSVTATKGGITFLRGGNGTGKTTLLLLIAGILHATSGYVHKYVGEHDKKSNVASVFTDMEIPELPLQSLIEELECDALWLQEKSPQLFDADLLERFNTSIKKNQILKGTSLSAGQKQKIMFLLVLAQRRPILLLDEAFSSMDANSKRYCYELVREELKTSLFCCICVTHTEESLAAQDVMIDIAFWRTCWLFGKACLQKARICDGDATQSLHMVF